jgi:hypothetical protein
VKEIKNLPASIRARLLSRSRASGEDFGRTLLRYGVERLLFRLSQHWSCDRFVLKGAMLFITWAKGAHRTTGDLDLLGYGPPDPATMRSIFAEVCAVSVPDDGLVFDAGSIKVEVMREQDTYQGLRVTMLARLDKAEIHLQIDVGFGDAVHPVPKKSIFPCLLPDMGIPEILAYPPETVVAEKFEAMVRFGEADSRLKDFNDIWAISYMFEFDMATLVRAVIGTFERRETDLPSSIPFALTAAFGEVEGKRRMWDAFLRRSPPAVIPPTLDSLLADLRRFLGPVLDASARPEQAHGAWDPTRGWTL